MEITYKVKAGDNLTNIAKRFNVTIEAIQAANDIPDIDLIFIGQILMITTDNETAGLTIRIIDNGVRLRSAPEFADNVITLLGKDTLFSNATLTGDWWQVPYQETNGYVHTSMVETTLPNPDPVIPPNEIVYRSQWDRDANNRVNDCGQTCVAMLAGSRGVNVDINELPYQSSSTGLSNAHDLVKNFDHLNLTTAQASDVPMGSPTPNNSIYLIWYGGLDRSSVQDKRFKGWHWVVFLHEADGGVIVHDPDFWGNRRNEGSEKFYSRAEWDAAFIPYGSGSTRTCVVLQ